MHWISIELSLGVCWLLCPTNTLEHSHSRESVYVRNTRSESVKTFMFKFSLLAMTSAEGPGDTFVRGTRITAADISFAWLLPKLSKILPRRHDSIHAFCSKFTVPNFTKGIPDSKRIKSQGAFSSIVSPEVSHRCRISSVYWLDRMRAGWCGRKGCCSLCVWVNSHKRSQF